MPTVIDFRDQSWAKKKRAFTVLVGGISEDQSVDVDDKPRTTVRLKSLPCWIWAEDAGDAMNEVWKVLLDELIADGSLDRTFSQVFGTNLADFREPQVINVLQGHILPLK
jgi:hypothetical protein